MPIETLPKKWNRWVGLFSDLVAAITYAEGAVSRWTDHATTECRIEVVFRDGRSLQILSSGELQTEIDSRDLSEIRDIRARIDRGEDHPVPSISLRASNSAPAMRVEVKGEDRERLAGGLTELAAILDRGKARPSWYHRGLAGAATIALAIFGSIFGGLGLAAALGVSEDQETTVILSLMGLFAGVGVTTVWATPDLELLPPGGQPRAKQFRASVLGIILAVVTGVVASILYAAIWGRDGTN